MGWYSRSNNGPDKPLGRVAYLDGIRGWASFAVLLSHVLMCFLVLSTPSLQFNKARLAEDLATHNYLDISAGIVLRFASDRRLAVMVFFVLSGYVLSVGHLNPAKRKLALAAISRYFRLMIPILATSIIAYLLLKFGLMFNLQVATAPERSSGWLGTFYQFEASIRDVAAFSFYDVFFRYDSRTSYNSSLWTMAVELYGSFVIYAYLGIFRATAKVPWRLSLLTTLSLFVLAPVFSCFFIGYILAEVNQKYASGPFSGRVSARTVDALSAAVFFLTAVVSTYWRASGHHICIFAAALVASVSFSGSLRRVFAGRVSQFLGRISFPLYLIQIPIICSWSSYLYLRLPELGMDVATSNLVNLFSTILLALVSAALLLPIERFSVAYAKKIGGFLLS